MNVSNHRIKESIKGYSRARGISGGCLGPGVTILYSRTLHCGQKLSGQLLVGDRSLVTEQAVRRYTLTSHVFLAFSPPDFLQEYFQFSVLV